MPRSNDSPADRQRCAQKVGPAIEKWLRDRELSGSLTFHGDDIEAGVKDMTGCAYGTPLRILRESIRAKLVRVVCLSRSDSLYRITPLGSSPESQKPPAGPPTPRRPGALPSWECPCGCEQRLEEYGVARCFG